MPCLDQRFGGLGAKKCRLTGSLTWRPRRIFKRIRVSGRNAFLPWVVYDFALLDALECGVVKIPETAGMEVRYDHIMMMSRNFAILWLYVRDDSAQERLKNRHL